MNLLTIVKLICAIVQLICLIFTVVIMVKARKVDKELDIVINKLVNQMKEDV